MICFFIRNNNNSEYNVVFSASTTTAITQQKNLRQEVVFMFINLMCRKLIEDSDQLLV